MNPVVIDVREPYEYAQGHVSGSLNIPPAELLKGAPSLGNVSKQTPITVYCRTGSRSNVAMNILHDLGFANVTNGINKQTVEKHLNID